ncbi:MAG: LacI family DNA-binding transcriptional regulator [Lysobacterales bacterium]
MKTLTINDVALRLGVSKRTVSRVLNKSALVNDETRRRVEQVIRELNYSPDRQARGLASRRSFLLGLVYDLPTLFINEIQREVLSVCADAGYELVVHTGGTRERSVVEDVMQFVGRARVDGLIVLPPVSLDPALARALDGGGSHFVRFTSAADDAAHRLVVTNYQPAIDDMTGHLVSSGHRRLGFISGPVGDPSSQKRAEAFEIALRSHGLELAPDCVAEGAFTYESGIAAAAVLLQRPRRPTAIFAANDEMAFGVMKVAHELGLAIPGDLSLVGFDGSRFSSFVIPSLSTIWRPTEKMSRLGTQKLLAMIEHGADAARKFETHVTPEFVPRESTGPLTP